MAHSGSLGPGVCRQAAERRGSASGCSRYRTAGVIVEVDSLELLPFSAVTEDDVAAAGEADREALRVRAAHSGPIDDDTLVHRVEFHVV